MNIISLKTNSEKCLCGEQLVTYESSTNIHLYTCEMLNNEKHKLSFEKLFSGNIHQQKSITNILEENCEKIRAYSQARDSTPLSR